MTATENLPAPDKPAAANVTASDSEAIIVPIHNRMSRIVPDVWAPIGMCALLLSGAHAHVLLSVYNSGQIAQLLGLENVAQSQVFTLFYLIGLGTALPFIVILTVYLTIRASLDQMKRTIRVDERGIHLPQGADHSCTRTSTKGRSECLRTREQIQALGEGPKNILLSPVLLLRELAGAKTSIVDRIFFDNSVVPWSQIISIEYRLSADVLRKPRIQINLSCAEGRNHCLNIDLLTLSQEDRKKLSAALCKWAPEQAGRRGREHVQRWQQLSRSLMGGQAEDKAVSYTDIWLDQDGKSVKRLKLLFPGEKIKDGKYKIIEALEGGGQSNVYLAENQENGAADFRVVLKEFIIPAGSPLAHVTSEPFEVEKNILEKLEHPGVVKLLDSFAEPGKVCLVFARAPGKTLSSLVQEKGPLPELEALSLASNLAGILKYLHSQNPVIIHRDFVPNNIIVDTHFHTFESANADAESAEGEPSGVVFQPCHTATLIDFASALQKSEGDEAEKEESVGTLAFTAPEQFRGRACSQSDIYSFGATLYFALTGLEPEPLRKLDPRQENQNVSVELARIIGRATEQELKLRYQDIDEVLADLLSCANLDIAE